MQSVVYPPPSNHHRICHPRALLSLTFSPVMFSHNSQLTVGPVGPLSS